MNQDVVKYLAGEVERRNAPAEIAGIPGKQEVHIHYHAAPETVAAADPAKRTTMDDGILAWFMPYFVIGILSFILCGSVVGLIMALAVVLMGLVVTLVQALATAALLAGVSVLIAGWGVSEMRSRKGQKTK